MYHFCSVQNWIPNYAYIVIFLLFFNYYWYSVHNVMYPFTEGHPSIIPFFHWCPIHPLLLYTYTSLYTSITTHPFQHTPKILFRICSSFPRRLLLCINLRITNPLRNTIFTIEIMDEKGFGEKIVLGCILWQYTKVQWEKSSLESALFLLQTISHSVLFLVHHDQQHPWRKGN